MSDKDIGILVDQQLDVRLYRKNPLILDDGDMSNLPCGMAKNVKCNDRVLSFDVEWQGRKQPLGFRYWDYSWLENKGKKPILISINFRYINRVKHG